MNTIKPVTNPRFLDPGHPDYPAPDETFLVMGVELADDPRAYPISMMSHHEAVDDRFGEQYVAVAY